MVVIVIQVHIHKFQHLFWKRTVFFFFLNISSNFITFKTSAQLLRLSFNDELSFKEMTDPASSECDGMCIEYFSS